MWAYSRSVRGEAVICLSDYFPLQMLLQFFALRQSSRRLMGPAWDRALSVLSVLFIVHYVYDEVYVIGLTRECINKRLVLP